MALTLIEVKDLAGRFEELLALAAAGEQVIVTEGTVPRARLLPLPSSGGPRIPALHAGMIETSPDFDDPLPDSFWLGES